MNYTNTDSIYKSYQEIFSEKLEKCKSKKDYKKLCKSMIRQFAVIDGVDENQRKIFSSLIGTDAYDDGMALAIKMYILELQGISTDIVSVCDNPFDHLG